MQKNDITLMENLAKVTLNVAENEKWSATDVTRMLASMALKAAQHMRAVDASPDSGLAQNNQSGLRR